MNLLISPHPATRIAQRGRSFDGEEGKEAMTTNIIVNFVSLRKCQEEEILKRINRRVVAVEKRMKLQRLVAMAPHIQGLEVVGSHK